MPSGNGTQQGYTYLLMLFVVALFGYGLALLGETWRAIGQRELRLETEFVLESYTRALASYRTATPDGASYRPRRLEELIEDTRTGVKRRHLRRLYRNPMSGKFDWLLRTDALGVVAVCLPTREDQCSQADLAWP